VENITETSQFTASDVREAGGISYRQLSDWDSKGALPSQRAQNSGWRKFDPRQFFVILVCSEIRKQFGVPIAKLAWLQKFMLQDEADHFSVATEMMRHGLAVLILTDLSEQFDMDADFAIGDLLKMGYCRYDKPQGYVLLLVNPLINKMLAALKNPVRLEISDTIYDAIYEAQAARTVRDMAELEVLQTMRQSDTSKFTVEHISDEEVLLEIYENTQGDRADRKDWVPPAEHEEDQAPLISPKVVKKVARVKF
jgi:DNA-binding transcriptional MerR regulator